MRIAFLSAVVVVIIASGSAAQTTPAEQQPVEHGTKRADGLEVTLLSAPPLSSAEMQKHMPGMGGMRGMQGRSGMSGGMGGRGEMSSTAGEAPTHWIGVVVRDVKSDGVVRDAEVTLTAKKGQITRTMRLMPMPGSYGANISLPQRGRYAVTVGVVRAGQSQAAAFDFDYR